MSRPGDDEAAVSDGDEQAAPLPWPQRLYQSIWLWAGAALLFWLVSYVIWGVIDLLVLAGG